MTGGSAIDSGISVPVLRESDRFPCGVDRTEHGPHVPSKDLRTIRGAGRGGRSISGGRVPHGPAPPLFVGFFPSGADFKGPRDGYVAFRQLTLMKASLFESLEPAEKPERQKLHFENDQLFFSPGLDTYRGKPKTSRTSARG